MFRQFLLHLRATFGAPELSMMVTKELHTNKDTSHSVGVRIITTHKKQHTSQEGVYLCMYCAMKKENSTRVSSKQLCYLHASNAMTPLTGSPAAIMALTALATLPRSKITSFEKLRGSNLMVSPHSTHSKSSVETASFHSFWVDLRISFAKGKSAG